VLFAAGTGVRVELQQLAPKRRRVISQLLGLSPLDHVPQYRQVPPLLGCSSSPKHVEAGADLPYSSSSSSNINEVPLLLLLPELLLWKPAE
jgi:hypothetical protein